VHALPSVHAAPVRGDAVQVAVPLQLRRTHASEVHVTACPVQRPEASQTSSKVHAFPSLQALPVRGVTVQVAVPLQSRVVQASLAQTTFRPTHAPRPLHASP
jgi:hypothetical protein